MSNPSESRSRYWHAPFVSRAVLRRLTWRFTRVDKSGLLAGHLFQRHLAAQIKRRRSGVATVAAAFAALDNLDGHYSVLGIKEANRLLDTVNRLMVEQGNNRGLRVFGPGPGQFLVAIPIDDPSSTTWTDDFIDLLKVVRSTEGLLRPISFSTGIAIATEDHAYSETVLPSVLVAQRTVARARTRMQRVINSGGDAVAFPAASEEREGGLILLLDADDLHAEMMKALLQREGLRMLHLRDGNDAARFCRETMPDAILCDSALPATHPVDLYRELRNDWHTAEIPFIVLARTRDESTLETYFNAGLLHVIGKPYFPIEVTGLLRAILARSV